MSFEDKFIIVVCSIILSIFISYSIITAVYFRTNGRFFKRICHDLLGYHLPSTNCKIEGCNISSICPVCGKKVCKDSQGNWFVPEDYFK